MPARPSSWSGAITTRFSHYKGRDFFKTLVPATQVHAYDAGHFALETHSSEIASQMVRFLDPLLAVR